MSGNTETPVKPKHVSGASYRSGHLSMGRLAVLQDLGDSIPEVPFEWLLENVVPLIEYNHEETKRRLMDQKHITNGRWSDFPKDPAASGLDEAKTFQALDSVIQKIIKCAAVPQGHESLKFFNNPNRAPHSLRSNDTRPDSYFARERDSTLPDVIDKSTSKAPLHNWDDIALSAEYKKGTSEADRDDNAEKILWSMHHVLRSDPCRRFTYGITVENTQMRIWFACRSKVFVTTSFDFIRNYDVLISFVMSFTYADTVDLGWDSTIRRVFVNGVVQYDITVHDVSEGEVVERVFRTTRVLADFGADALRGRGTRVFEARQWIGTTLGDDLFAIKDVWVDIDRDREGHILQQLQHDVGEDWTELKKYLVTVLHHGDVIINKQTDHTLDLILRGHNLPTDSRFMLKLKTPEEKIRESSIGATPSELTLARAPHIDASYQHKAHYRLVYKEVAQPVHSTRKLADFFQALVDATIGLELMHRHGWVHRDISSGNILLYQGHGKLSDLEYAKRMGAQGSHEIRTGTIDFMSLEVERQGYMFWKRPRSLDKSPGPPPFRYNPLHDLESLWWISVWMVLYHRSHPTEQGDDERAAAMAQQAHYRRTFPGRLDSASREATLNKDPTLWQRLESLPSTCQPAAQQLEVVRWALLNHYETAEAGPEIDTAAFKGLHKLFIDALRDAQKKSNDVQVRSLADILRGFKRQPQGDDGDGALGYPGELAEEPRRKRERNYKSRGTLPDGAQG